MVCLLIILYSIHICTSDKLIAIHTHSKLNFAITIINRKEYFTWHREGDRVK